MTGPEVTTAADLRERVGQAIHDSACTGEDGCAWDEEGEPCDLTRFRPFAAAALSVVQPIIDQRTRVAASLEADLARILDAWDTYEATPRGELQSRVKARRRFTDAIAAAREWVGREA